MYQSFSAPSDPSTADPRVARLRDLMAKAGVDAYLVPRADEHQGEYVPPSAERLKWLTGFSGSAGLAAVATRKAALFVDGRYTVQAAQECDASLFDMPGLARAKLPEWLQSALPDGGVVGFDPWLHTGGEVTRLGAQLKAKGLKLRPLGPNLVDKAWGKDRPAPPKSPVSLHPIAAAGETAQSKLARVAKRVADDRQDALILTLPDSICWLFNIRGGDVAHNPVALAFALIHASGKAELFIDPDKLGKDVRQELETVAKILLPAKLQERLAALVAAGKRVRFDPETAAYAVKRALGKRSGVAGSDPIIQMKAIKNAVEIEGARRAHVRDGQAMVRYLAWLEGAAAGGKLDEINAVETLEAFRRETNALKEISFDTISGSGAHGAIVHYRVSEKTNRTLRKGELFLIDSGAQYEDGTTDITRTVAIGQPTKEMRERFTLVLKGHIGIATSRFPQGTRGIELDAFARRALWSHGLDYDHGTGHGVGSYLSVHEGPQSISRAGMVALEPGMILSNEPGYYKEGHYGIRIENLVLVTEPEVPQGGERPMMGFETLTLAPIDRRLIVPGLLSADERQWLDQYHARVRTTLSRGLDRETRAWLETATAPLD
ncbi:MAG: aminopeptidase P family protein [Hyphomicrobium sp.]|nr:aminopeptidase P family protein [Hyphomicrobium sp.]